MPGNINSKAGEKCGEKEKQFLYHLKSLFIWHSFLLCIQLLPLTWYNPKSKKFPLSIIPFPLTIELSSSVLKSNLTHPIILYALWSFPLSLNKYRFWTLLLDLLSWSDAHPCTQSSVIMFCLLADFPAPSQKDNLSALQCCCLSMALLQTPPSHIVQHPKLQM